MLSARAAESVRINGVVERRGRGRLKNAWCAQDLREETSAEKPHARICEGEAEWPSYSTRNLTPRRHCHGSAGAELMPAIVAHDGQVHLSRWPRYRTQCAPMTETR